MSASEKRFGGAGGGLAPFETDSDDESVAENDDEWIDEQIAAAGDDDVTGESAASMASLASPASPASPASLASLDYDDVLVERGAKTKKERRKKTFRGSPLDVESSELIF